MLDYLGLSALAAVIETQNFEVAAQKLFISQSAISQRIKSLENFYGESLLIRTLPYSPTILGEILLSHYKQVLLLEEAVMSRLESKNQLPRLSISISRDSLETWFTPILKKLNTIPPILLEVISDDQELTLDYLKKGSVSACASTASKPIVHCKAIFLGYFDYVLVASPAFKKQYFKNKNHQKNLIQAPTVIFDKNDYLHHRYLEKYFNIDDTTLLNYHIVPSVQHFRELALNGDAYALIPKIDIERELKEKKLINLFPDKRWEMPVYWHSWNIETRVYQAFNDLVIKSAKIHLRQ